MIVVTTPTIPEKTIVRTIGLVRGNTIRARHIGKDINLLSFPYKIAVLRCTRGHHVG